MTSIHDLASDFGKHLAEEGFLFNTKPESVELELESEMGNKRYIKYCRAANKFHCGEKPIESLYREIQTLREASLLFSHQTDIVCESGAWLASKMQELDQGIPAFADLGCATGYLTRWLKKRFPSSQAHGFDNVDGFVRLANSTST